MDRQHIISDLAARRGLPWHSLSYCLREPSSSVPVFLLMLERKSRGLSLSRDEDLALYYGIHLLGALRVTEAFAPLKRLLGGEVLSTAQLLGDAIADTIPQVLMAIGPDRGDAAFETLLNPETDWVIRDAFLRHWTFEVLGERVDRASAVEKLAVFPENAMPEPGDMIWISWMTAIADLGLRELEPQVMQLLEQGCIQHAPLTVSDADLEVFQEDLRIAEQVQTPSEHRNEWLQARRYIPFGPDHQDFVRAARHAASISAPGDQASEPIRLKAADRVLPFDDSSRS